MQAKFNRSKALTKRKGKNDKTKQKKLFARVKKVILYTTFCKNKKILIVLDNIYISIILINNIKNNNISE